MVNMAPVKVTFWVDDNGMWLASCPDLDLTTQGETYEEAQYNLKDALMLFFESCIKRGTLDKVLEEAGYERPQQERVHDYLNGYAPKARAGAQACPA